VTFRGAALGAGLVVALAAPASAGSGEAGHDAINFKAASYFAVEAATSEGVAELERCCHGTGPASVTFSATSGTAAAGSDFTSVNREVSFGSGIEDAEVSVRLQDDAEVEPVETVQLALSDPSEGAILAYPRDGTLTIVDGDGPSRVSFGVTSLSTFENRGRATVSVVRSGDASPAATVTYSATPGTAEAGSDFEDPPDGQISFAAGQRFKSFAITLIDDQVREGPEELSLALSASSGAELTEPSAITLRIEDDDESSGDTVAPLTALHEPLHGHTYRRSRLKTVLVFNQDNEGGSGVDHVEVAIRKDLVSGKCAWWNGKTFERGSCSKKRWVRKNATSEIVVYDIPRAFEPSRGTGVKSYLAFSRGTDVVGNVQRGFDKEQNKVRFEVKR